MADFPYDYTLAEDRRRHGRITFVQACWRHNRRMATDLTAIKAALGELTNAELHVSAKAAHHERLCFALMPPRRHPPLRFRHHFFCARTR